MPLTTGRREGGNATLAITLTKAAIVLLPLPPFSDSLSSPSSCNGGGSDHNDDGKQATILSLLLSFLHTDTSGIMRFALFPFLPLLLLLISPLCPHPLP